MTWWQAALWGLAGGGAAAALSFSAAVVSSGYHWPWRERRKSKQQLGPRLFVLAVQTVLGALVAAAAHDQISGPWPAFIFGIGAPHTIRGILSGVEVIPRSINRPPGKAPPDASSQPPAAGEESLREDVP